MPFRESLVGASEQTLQNAGIRRLHKQIVAQSPAVARQLLELPRRPNGSSRVVQASLFHQLLNKQVELKACMESQVSGAVSDLRHLTLAQLLTIRHATVILATDSSSQHAYRAFIAALDQHLCGKLVDHCLDGTEAEELQATVKHAIGHQMILVTGAVDELSSRCSGEAAEVLNRGHLWILYHAQVENTKSAIFNADDLQLKLVRNFNSEIGREVPQDQTVRVLAKGRKMVWEITYLDPRAGELEPWQRNVSLRRERAALRACSAPGRSMRFASTDSVVDSCDVCGSANPKNGVSETTSPLRTLPLKDSLALEEAPQAEENNGIVEAVVQRTQSDEAAQTFRMAPVDAVAYVRQYGYPACSANGVAGWTDADNSAFPIMRLRVCKHGELDKHTYYSIESSLSASHTCTANAIPIFLCWKSTKRLQALRKELYAVVKQGLGDDEYNVLFGAAPFARHMGVPGTTSRLGLWCQTLAACMNSGRLNPVTVAAVLKFLEAPRPNDEELAFPLRPKLQHVAVTESASSKGNKRSRSSSATGWKGWRRGGA